MSGYLAAILQFDKRSTCHPPHPDILNLLKKNWTNGSFTIFIHLVKQSQLVFLKGMGVGRTILSSTAKLPQGMSAMIFNLVV